MIKTNFIKLYESSFKENWNLVALTDLNETTSYTYGELAEEIEQMHLLFEQMGIKQGDKVALIGRNHSSWIIVFMATITYGAVIVPILQDFHPDNILNIIDHSESKICFIDLDTLKNIEQGKLTLPIFVLPSFDLLHSEETGSENLKSLVEEQFSDKYPKGFHAQDIKYPDISNESVVCINYTSGSASFIRGVMLTGNNYAGNIVSIRKMNLIFKGENNVVFLPMAHAFSCTFDFLYGLTVGAHSHILSRIRHTNILLEAFQKVKPNLISTVPLILEKIVERERKEISERPLSKFLLKTPLLNRIVYREIRKKLFDIFGGNYREMLVGGATIDNDIEDFLIKIKFPFTVGYGMTECAPVISLDSYKVFVPRSCGSVNPDTMEARIDSKDAHNVPGEIQVRGEHVMKGYYKNPEATAEAFTKDGWLKTGDLGTMDKENRLYIKGLVKTMILGSNGQNIYPKKTGV